MDGEINWHDWGVYRFSGVDTEGVVHAIEHRSSQTTEVPDELRLTTKMRIDNNYSDQVAGIHHGCLNATFSQHFERFHCSGRASSATAR